MILSEHLVKCDTDDKPFDTYWYKYTVGRLQQVFLAVSIKYNTNTFYTTQIFYIIKILCRKNLKLYLSKYVL